MEDTQKVVTPAASTQTQNQAPVAKPFNGKKHKKNKQFALNDLARKSEVFFCFWKPICAALAKAGPTSPVFLGFPQMTSKTILEKPMDEIKKSCLKALKSHPTVKKMHALIKSIMPQDIPLIFEGSLSLFISSAFSMPLAQCKTS